MHPICGCSPAGVSWSSHGWVVEELGSVEEGEEEDERGGEGGVMSLQNEEGWRADMCTTLTTQWNFQGT